MTDPKNLQEAPASATASVKSAKGFPLLWTLRAETGTELMAKYNAWEEEAIKAGWIPQERGFGGGGNAAPKVTKDCWAHPGEQATQRMGKDGKPFFSHAIKGQFQTDGKPAWCNKATYDKPAYATDSRPAATSNGNAEDYGY